MSTRRSEWWQGALAVTGAMAVYAGLAWGLSSAAIEPAQAPSRVGPDGEGLAFDFGPPTVERTVLRLHKAGFEYQCSECHMEQPRSAASRRFIGEHRQLEFNHGANDRCFNCHHPDPDLADQFITRDGQPLPYTDHVDLCASCHGVVHRDWRNGAHGRRAGHWDRTVGKAQRTGCIVCHDPHHPQFAAITPLPPPGVVRGPARSGLEPHSAAARLLNERVAPEAPALRGPAIDPDEEPDHE